MIEVANDTAGSITVSISVEGDKKSHFTPVVLGKPLKNKNTSTVAVGTLPCRFLKLEFGPSKVGAAVAVAGLKIIGCEQMDKDSSVADLFNSATQFQILKI